MCAMNSITRSVTVTLLLACAACGENDAGPSKRDAGSDSRVTTQVPGLDSGLDPACRGTIFDGIVGLAAADVPYRCELTVSAYVPGAPERMPHVALRDTRGRILLEWDCTWLDGFVVHDDVLYRATPDYWPGPPHKENELSAFDLKEGGRELWRTKFSIPRSDEVDGLLQSRIALRRDESGALLLTVGNVGTRILQYTVDRVTGALSTPRIVAGQAPIEAPQR